MKIAQISTLHESVPPKLYGGTERVVSYLTEELVKLGHDVTLYASGDSVTAATLRAMTPESLRLCQNCFDPLTHHMVEIEHVFREAGDYDVLHSHIEYLAFPLIRRNPQLPIISTLHNRLDTSDYKTLYKEYTDIPLVSISNGHRKTLPWANWQGTVYHGLPHDLYSLNTMPGDYVAVVGRISPEKGIDESIRIAIAAGMPIKIGAKIDKKDEEYFKEVIEPLLNNPLVEFIGEVTQPEKKKLLCNAAALLFTINWPEPFGLVMVEAMACGTPVIAYPYGSVPEIIEHGVNGFIVNDQHQAVEALDKIHTISRKRCRSCFEERFTSRQMALNYIKIYERMIERSFHEERYPC